MNKLGYFFLIFYIVVGSLFFSKSNSHASFNENNLKRFGIGWGYISKDYQSYDPENLGIGWYTDWGYKWTPTKIVKDLYGKGIQRLTLVLKDNNDYYSTENCSELKNYVTNNPDAFDPKMTFWSVGNELGFDIQNLTAAKYASEFIKWRDCIKEINPQYKVGSGAVISLWTHHPRTFPSSCVTDLSDPYSGYTYLKTYINNIRNTNSSKLPDFMVMHAYYGCTPPENGQTNNFSKFKNHILSHRKLMKELGLQNKELWIKEYNNDGYEQGGPAFLTASIDYLMNAKDTNLGYPNDDYRLVQRFNWFLLNNTEGTSPQWNQILANANGQLTSYGKAFQGASKKYAGIKTTASPSPSIGNFKSADANSDGVVDGQDYVIWLNNYGQSLSGKRNGDFNKNGIVDGLDYVVWLNEVN